MFASFSLSPPCSRSLACALSLQVAAEGGGKGRTSKRQAEKEEIDRRARELQREMAHKMGDIGTAVAAVSVRQGDEDLDGRCVGGRCVGVARLHAADAGNDDTRTPPSETEETALEAHAPAAQRSLLHDADELLLVPSPSPMAVYQVHQVHRRRPETD